MPRLSLEYLKSLTEVVHDVKSPRVSIPRAGFERRSCSLLRRLHQLNQSIPSESPPGVADCGRILFPLYPHFRRVGMRRRLQCREQVDPPSISVTTAISEAYDMRNSTVWEHYDAD
jgi:hypothetical protein